MTPQEELIAETQGLKAIVASLVGVVSYMGGEESNLKEKLYQLALETASNSPATGPGIDTEAVAARTLATIDNVFTRVQVNF